MAIRGTMSRITPSRAVMKSAASRIVSTSIATKAGKAAFFCVMDRVSVVSPAGGKLRFHDLKEPNADVLSSLQMSPSRESGFVVTVYLDVFGIDVAHRRLG